MVLQFLCKGNSQRAKPQVVQQKSQEEVAATNALEISEAKLKSAQLLLDEATKLLLQFPSDDPKDTPLHVAVLDSYSDEFIINQLKPDSETVSKQNNNGELPLHYAMKNKSGVSKDVLDMLIKLHPEGVKQGNFEKSLPIHTACQFGASNLDAIKSLLKIYPESVMEQSEVALPFQRSSNESNEEDDLDETEDDADASDIPGNGFFFTFMQWMAVDENEDNEEKEKDSDLNPIDEHTESGLSPLHFAIFNGAPPEVIDYIIGVNPGCIDLKSTQGRTALRCGKSIVKEYLNKSSDLNIAKIENSMTKGMSFLGPDEIVSMPESIQNTLAAIDTIEVFRKRSMTTQTLRATVLATRITLTDPDVIEGNEAAKRDARLNWKKTVKAFKFIGSLNKTDSSMLGQKIKQDSEDAVIPDKFTLPTNLDHICIETDLPVGFLRVRWAILHEKSEFILKCLFEDALNYEKVKGSKWSSFSDKIGGHGHQEVETKFIGASRDFEYLMPKSGFVGANMAYEKMELIEYNSHCFALQKCTKNPDVPYGNKFEALTRIVIVNQGKNNCKITCSVEPKFIGSKPMVHRQIKNAMRAGTTEFFASMANCICEQATI